MIIHAQQHSPPSSVRRLVATAGTPDVLTMSDGQDNHVYTLIPGMERTAITRATSAEVSTEHGRQVLDQQLLAHLQEFPNLHSVIAVAPGQTTSVVVQGRPDAVAQSLLDGPYDAMARLSSSSTLKNALPSFPGQRYEVKPFGGGQEIQLAGQIEPETISLALSEGAQSNNFRELKRLVEDLPQDRRVVILLAGPSGAGKSTLIRNQIKEFAAGRELTTVSGDNNFRDIDDPGYPLTQNGGLFFDSPQAMDLARLSHDVIELAQTGQAQLPVYNWVDERPGGWHHPVTAHGFREDRTQAATAGDKSLIVVDTIHAANTQLVKDLQLQNVPFRVVYLDSERAEDRLQRRMMRDEKERALPAQSQFGIWEQSIRRGEMETIVPSLLNMDPGQDTYVRVKFPNDLGLSLDELQAKAAVFQEWGLQATPAAFQTAEDKLPELMVSEEKRLNGVLADVNAPQLDRDFALKGLQNLRASVHYKPPA